MGWAWIRSLGRGRNGCGENAAAGAAGAMPAATAASLKRTNPCLANRRGGDLVETEHFVMASWANFHALEGMA